MEEHRSALLAWLIKNLARILGYDEDQIRTGTTLEELGLESMSVVALGREIERYFPAVPKTFLYDCRTIGDVADYLLGRFPENAALMLATEDPRDAAAGRGTIGPDRFASSWEPLQTGAAEGGEGSPPAQAIAVIGVAGRFPGAPDLDAFARNLMSGLDAVDCVPPTRWAADPIFRRDPVARGSWGATSKWGGFLADIDAFDSAFFGISAMDADVMDPQERLFIECAWHALEHAGLGSERLPRSSTTAAARVGVFAGVTTHSYPLLGPELWRAGSGQVPTSMPWSIANRVSYLLNFDGPSFAVDSACSSSLTAIHLACASLHADECEVALAGGVNLYLHPAKYVQLSQQRMLSPTGRCRAFGEEADGFAPGEGVGIVVLRRLDRAIAAGDRILGVIRATAIAHGGRTNGYTVPSAQSQTTLIRATLGRANIAASRISYVEAHGTGTSLGDPLEVEGLIAAYAGADVPAGRCALGSVKSNIGHLESAAAIAGLTKILLQLQAKRIFPTLHSQQVNRAIDFARTPFRLARSAEAWEGDGEPRCAALSSFGAGGANGHLVIEEWEGSPAAAAPLGDAAMVFPFSADAPDQLAVLVGRVGSWLDDTLRTDSDSIQAESLAYTLQLGRTGLRYRFAVVASSLRDLAQALRSYDPARFTADDGGATAGTFYGVARAGGEVSSSSLPTAAAALARLWVGGELPSWSTFWRGPAALVDAPLYPFRRTRHWVADGAPLGSPGPGAADGAVAHEWPATRGLDINPEDWRVSNHVVGGRRVFPAAAYLQEVCNLACALPDFKSAQGTGIELSNLMWGRPLYADEPASAIVSVNNDGRFSVMQADSAAPSYLEGAVRQLGLPAGGPSAQVADMGADMPVGEDFYRRLSNMGLDYGPQFQTIRRLARNQKRAIATLTAIRPGVRGPIDPALLDGVFQCAVALAPEAVANGSRSFVPFSLRSFKLWGAIEDSVQVAVDYGGVAGAGLHTFDFAIRSMSGETIATLEGFCFRHYDVPGGEAASALHLLERRWWLRTDSARAVPLRGPTLVVGARPGEPDALAARLGAGSADHALWSLQAATSFRYHDNQVELDLQDPSQRHALVELLRHRDAFPATLVYVADDATAGGTHAAAQAARTFITLVQALAAQANSQHLQLVYMFGPVDRDSRCFHAAVAGLLRSVGLEAPQISATVVELAGDRPTAVPQRADALAAVLSREAPQAPVTMLRYTNGRLEEERFGWMLDPAIRPWLPAPGGVYLITGGLGALGRTFARWLAVECGVHVALVSRTPAQASDQRSLEALQASGARVRHFQGDVSDAASVQRTLAAVRTTLGPITGIVHAAGVLRDAFFLKHSDADWNAVLAPKIEAARLLDTYTADDPLEAFILFSSLAGAHGNVGQSVYAYANAWLDEFAAARAQQVAERTRNGRTLALGWPLWKSDTGMQAPPTLMQWMAEQGLELLEAEEGVRALQLAMASGRSGVTVCKGRRAGVARLLDVADSASAPPSPPPPAPLTAPAARPPAAEAGSRAVKKLADMLSRASGMARARIQADTAIQSIGLDSVMVMGLNSELEQHFRSMPKTLLYEADTVHDLAQRLQRIDAEGMAAFAGVADAAAQAPEAPPAAPAVAAAQSAEVTPARARIGGTADGRSADLGRSIAIVGLAGRYPRAADLDRFWDNLVAGVDCVGEIGERWPESGVMAAAAGKRGNYARWAALIDDHDRFDPLFFGIAPRDAERMDPQERLFLEAAWLAIENAGYTPESLQTPASRGGARGRVGVLAGVMYGEYQFYGAAGSATLTNSSYSSIANRVSYTLGFNGPSFALDSMCSSSLTAIHTACLLLRAGECDAVLAGGVNISSHPYRYRMLSELQFAASDGRCRSFGAGGDGYVPGEGVGVVVLKRLEDAIRDGDHIHGVIRGSAIGHGGRSAGFTVPSPAGQAEVIRNAFDDAGLVPARLGYVEAHGTGTSLGDPIELRGIAMAFDGQLPEGFECPIGSVKSQIGHLESAAGIAALTKVLLQMRHGVLAPSIHSDPLNPNIDFSELPFYVQREAAPWTPVQDGDGRPLPRLAAVSSFGAGGSNAHLVVEELIEAERPPADTQRPELVVLSARSADGLRAMANDLLRFVDLHLRRDGTQERLEIGPRAFSLTDVAATLREGRVHHPVRVALLADGLRCLAERLRELTARGLWTAEDAALPADVFTGTVDSTSAGDRAYEGDPTLPAVARAWVAGSVDDWSAVPGIARLAQRRRVPMPGTRFQRRRFWAEASERPTLPEAPARLRETPAVPAVAAPLRAAPPPPSPREIYDQVVRGELSIDQAKALLTTRIGNTAPLTAGHPATN